ncbi:putative leader peptide [Streptomyces sp. NBC_01476]|uniref:putative leader peptide n=1 Tax=Streptomyces sp. NBC_01476 TaxID=2903881 RepID=UPI003FCD1D4E
MTARHVRTRHGASPSGPGGDAVREKGARSLPSVATFSRRHIDLQRVAGALCPGVPTAVPGPDHRPTALPRTAG